MSYPGAASSSEIDFLHPVLFVLPILHLNWCLILSSFVSQRKKGRERIGEIKLAADICKHKKKKEKEKKQGRKEKERERKKLSFLRVTFI